MLRIRTAAAALLLAFAALPLATAPSAMAERFRHYEARQSNTLKEAVENFAAYNAKIAAVMAKDELTDTDLERIHELTYTLEDALARINRVMQALPQTLETLHIASENHQPAAVRGAGAVYLDIATTVIPVAEGAVAAKAAD